MVLKYSDLFTMADPINQEPVTINVEYIAGKGVQAVAIRTIEGGYDSQRNFDRAVDRFFDKLQKMVDAAKPYMNPNAKNDDVKLYSSIRLSPHSARRLVDSLIAALEASEKS